MPSLTDLYHKWRRSVLPASRADVAMKHDEIIHRIEHSTELITEKLDQLLAIRGPNPAAPEQSAAAPRVATPNTNAPRLPPRSRESGESKTASADRRYCLDLGMHIGDDTAYYLYRGFDVVAVEANPHLVKEAEERFAQPIAEGRLTIIARALTPKGVDSIEFYVSATNSEWSSLDKSRVDQTGGGLAITVPGITLAEILDRFGTPHFIKCDLEGADEEFVEQLAQVSPDRHPEFVSVEGISTQLLNTLGAIGFDRVQLVSQARIRRGFDPKFRFVTADGEEREWQFPGHSSGKFGRDLDAAKWIGVPEARRRYEIFAELRALDFDMVLDNWLDFHVTTSRILEGG
jgi:FkbM family methyltransferase